jgi:oligopeptide/dipeptide ABC transporter ATP-binding protein
MGGLSFTPGLEMAPILELNNVTKVYVTGFVRKSSTLALDGFSLSVGGERPSITALAGESGSGKTTAGLLLLGFLAPTRGEILYRGNVLHRMSRREWYAFRREVQAIFQDPFAAYNPFYRVDHILKASIARFHLTKSKAERQALMEQALLGVGLRPEEILGRYPHQLSGGQRQRIIVARALVLRPQLIIADEPVSMVDASLRATILESLCALNKNLGISILYITHDLTTAYHISDDIVVLYQGSVTEGGDVELVIKDPQHPYTQLLVGSIPWPDPDLRWSREQIPIPRPVLAIGTKRGCKFAPRCPFVMSMCRESPPPLFRTADCRAAACYLYRDAPVIKGNEIGQVLGQKAKPTPEKRRDA